MFRFIIVLFAMLSSSAFAAPEDVAIQHRKYTLKNEVVLGGVWYPQHAFYKAVGLDVSYAHHFNDLIGSEVLRANLTARWDTHLKDLLYEEWGAEPEEFEEVKYAFTSHLQIKPFYGKFALANRSLVCAEVYFTVGGGLAFTTWRKVPLVNLGVGARVYLHPNWSTRFEFEEQLFLQDKTVRDNLVLHLGIARSFR